MAFDEGQVGLGDAARFEGGGEHAVGVVLEGDDHDAAGLAVEAVHESGADEAAGFEAFVGPVLEDVDEGAVLGIPRGVGDDAGGLVDDEDPGSSYRIRRAPGVLP